MSRFHGTYNTNFGGWQQLIHLEHRYKMNAHVAQNDGGVPQRWGCRPESSHLFSEPQAEDLGLPPLPPQRGRKGPAMRLSTLNGILGPDDTQPGSRSRRANASPDRPRDRGVKYRVEKVEKMLEEEKKTRQQLEAELRDLHHVATQFGVPAPPLSLSPPRRRSTSVPLSHRKLPPSATAPVPGPGPGPLLTHFGQADSDDPLSVRRGKAAADRAIINQWHGPVLEEYKELQKSIKNTLRWGQRPTSSGIFSSTS